MVQSLRHAIGFQISRFHFRKSRDRVLSFSEAVTKAKSILLIMPFDTVRDTQPEYVIGIFKKQFDEHSLTVVTNDASLADRKVLPARQIIHMGTPDVTTFFLPSEDVIDKVKRRQYDLAIDLSIDLVLPSGYIAKESDARVRIGFARSRADTFFNFQIQRDPDLNPKLMYERLARCLQMF